MTKKHILVPLIGLVLGLIALASTKNVVAMPPMDDPVDDDDDISFTKQQVTVPANQPYLTYWYWIASGDTCGYDFGGVIVNNVTVVDVYDLCTAENTGGWVRHSVNLGAYRGRSVSVQIRAETDSSANSNLFVDDVGFAAGAMPEIPTSAGIHSIDVLSKSSRLVAGPTTPGDESRLFHR